MKTKSLVLILLLALSTISMLAISVNIEPVAAEPIPKPGVVVWEDGGEAAAATLLWNPEWLKLRTENIVHSETTIIVQGEDCYGQNVEAKVVLPADTDPSLFFIFNDTHTKPPMPVTFSKIKRIFQQNGTHCNSFQILTEHEPFQEYLGIYHNDTGFEPGQCYPAFPRGTKYWAGHGNNIKATIQDVPVEPSNPDPLKVVINWFDGDQDLIPDSSEFPEPSGAKYAATLYFEGLDECGNKLIGTATIKVGDKQVSVDAGEHTWSTLCKVWGGKKGEEYFIFTHPTPQRPLFQYYIRIHHITIHPDCYDILAWPGEWPPGSGKYPGVTGITVALRDQDGNLVHAREDITVNFATSGGKIQPSYDVTIPLCHIIARANLTADTNARTIKVTADANVPEHGGPTNVPAMNLMAWTELTFDGINSVLFEGGWPIHTMMWGYDSWSYTDPLNPWENHFATFVGPVPPKPWLPPELGGPLPRGIKFDGPIYEVMIPLYVGCNLISSPVHPILCTEYYCEAYGGRGIPMDLLFGKTSARDCIEAIWWRWCESETAAWRCYIPGVSDDPDAFFTDGIGYWFKVEKPCTLEISGVLMENAPFVPPEYPVIPSWNLMGVTSVTGICTSDYLESLSASSDYPGYAFSTVGPIWVYYAKHGTWVRNPDMLWPTEAFWMYFKLPRPTLAP